MSTQPAFFQLPADEGFDGNKWYSWKETILSAANARGVYGYLNGSITKPTAMTLTTEKLTVTSYWGSMKPTPDEWAQRDAYAKSIITLNVKNPLGFRIRSTQTAAEAWNALTTTYDAVSDIGRLNAENALRSITHVNGTDITTHFAVLRKAWERAIGQGSKINDSEFRTIILGSMPREWSIYISTLYEQKTSADVIARLTMHDATIARHWKPAIQTTQALATIHQRTTRSTLVCLNPVCQRVGHTIDKCLGQYPDWWKKRGNATSVSTPKPEEQMHTANIALVPTEQVAATSEDSFYVFMTQCTCPHTHRIATYADSAASDHCFISVSDFSTYVPLNEKKGTTATAGGTFKIHGIGTVRKRVNFNGKVIKLTSP